LNEFLHPSLSDADSRIRVSVVGVTALDADKVGPQRSIVWTHDGE
jgi:hypothetical protein